MPDTLEVVQHILAAASTCDKTFKGHTGYHQTNIMCKKPQKTKTVKYCMQTDSLA